MTKQFTISSDPTSETQAAKELYRWYQDYLPPIPTLFNAKLGDISADAVSFSSTDGAEAKPLAATFEEAMLEASELAAMHKILEQADDAASSEEIKATMAKDPELAPSELENFSIFGSGYDSKTGVPSAEVPEFLSYQVERAAFTTFNGRVTKGLMSKKPALNTPADYQLVTNQYYDDSKRVGRFGKKVMGFAQFPDMYNSDTLFGWQRLAGTNPRVLQRLDTNRLNALLGKMALTDEHVQAVAGKGATMASEAASGHLYYCDYALLNGIKVQQGRYLYPAIGVFWSDARAQELRPVAIQLKQTKSRVFVPTDADWPTARAMFQVADFNYHEMGTHLSEAHFAQEAFIVAARRNFASNHPVMALFAQIYYALLFNNALGRMQLVNPGGYVDKIMAGDLAEGSLVLVKNYYAQVWNWDHWNLDTYLATQGTNDTTALPVYPYRDDGLPLWAAIKAFATQYIDAWYERDAVVANDRQVENFARELNDPTMGNMAAKGFPASIVTKAVLADVVARLIWQAGPGHGGVNYSQYEYFAPIPNAPAAAYANCDVPDGTPLPSLMDVFPPIEQTISQSDILNVLTQKVFGTMGQYDSDFVDGQNSAGKSAIKAFQNALTACSENTAHRNATDARRSRGYVWLDPTNLPNSTNI